MIVSEASDDVFTLVDRSVDGVKDVLVDALGRESPCESYVRHLRDKVLHYGCK